ncbi:hypothetical protein NL676_022494 [Syzygium grande]|nr:hypothetical protein NL676_022494 [Syzygium grande]
MDKPKEACESKEPHSSCAEQPQLKTSSPDDGAKVKSSKRSWRKIGDTILKALNLSAKTEKAGTEREMVCGDTNSQLKRKRREERKVKSRPRHPETRCTCTSVGIAENSRTRRLEEWESQLHQYNLLSW